MIEIAKISAFVTIPFAVLGCTVFAFIGELNALSFTIVWIETFLMVFLAFGLLIWRDTSRHKSAIAGINRSLLRSGDISDEEFLSSKPFEHPQLLLETRNAIAKVFNAPSCKISRGMHLRDDLRINQLDPWLSISILCAVLKSERLEHVAVRFPPSDLDTIDDLALWIYNSYISKASEQTGEAK